MPRAQTDYRQLHNRCPSCGHRLVMAEGAFCTVVNGEGMKSEKEIPCRCKMHIRTS